MELHCADGSESKSGLRKAEFWLALVNTEDKTHRVSKLLKNSQHVTGCVYEELELHHTERKKVDPKRHMP